MFEKDFKGAWGQATATIDWCEANYEVTYYVAEFWNTVSNLVMILLGVAGFVNSYRESLELRFICCDTGLFFVGVGSWLFHGTLLYESQLLDEMPMIYGTACLIYCLREISGPINKVNHRLVCLLVIYCSVVSLVYLTLKNPVFHEAAYGLMVASTFYYGLNIIRNHRHSTVLFISSMGMYATGFLIWNIDNIFCPNIRWARYHLGYPLKPLLQGHAWWHLLAGTGTYCTLLYSIHARMSYLERKPKFQMYLGIFPVITTQSKVQD